MDEELDLTPEERKALGDFVSGHEPQRSRMDRINVTIASIFAVLLLGAALLMAVWGLLLSPGAGIEYAAILFGALGLGPAIGVFLMVRKFGWKIALYQRGFVWVRGKPTVILWQDVKYLFQAVRLLANKRAEYELRLVMENGTTHTISGSYADFDDFAAAARAGINDAVFKRAARAFKAGESIPFGKLLVSPKGLEREGDTIVWADIESIGLVGVDLFAVTIVRKAKGKKERECWYAKDVPVFQNYEAFLKIAAKFTTVPPPRDTI